MPYEIDDNTHLDLLLKIARLAARVEELEKGMSEMAREQGRLKAAQRMARYSDAWD